MRNGQNLKQQITEQNHFIFIDGGMGTMLQQRGLAAGQLPELLNLRAPEIVCDIHRQYVAAGAHIISANTFGANRLKLGQASTPQEIIPAAIKLAKEAQAPYVALDIGPIGMILEPMGTLSVDEAYSIFSEQVRIGCAAGADLIIIETMSDLLELKTALLAAKENSNVPVLTSMTFAADGRTFMGTDPQTAAITMCALGADAIGVNCSLGPRELLPVVEEMLKWATVPLIVQANAGLPQTDGSQTSYNTTAEEYASYIEQMAEMGVSIFGGCCGTTPDFIRSMIARLSGKQPRKRQPVYYSAVCSGQKSLILDARTTVIGERINPTGKKKLKEALRSSDFDYVIGEALVQEEHGADILDVNVGLPELDEAAVLTRAVQEIQAISHLPLQIDSADVTALEAALRIYNGKPIINSVNGKEESLCAVLPLVKKYGAAVVALTLDERGIPERAEERVAIAKRICNKAQEYGILKTDIFIDCLALSLSSNQALGMETIRAIRMIKEQLGLKTVLGVSNISFGLPARDVINSTYLAAALGAGLDLPILNPLSDDYKRVISAFRVIRNEDKNAENYILSQPQSTEGIISKPVKDADNATTLIEAIIQGRKKQSALLTEELLQSKEPLDIINSYFVPALNEVGRRFDSGEMFLPQMIASAEAVQCGFDTLREKVPESTMEKGKIVLATVKGDIHDIGKNIVRMLLKNYGYQVIDLGRDVPPQQIVDTVREQQVPLVGLSALMTTTIKSMAETITALKTAGLDCQVMVGGAVLNPEYAKMVGADYYAADAMESARIAAKVFEQ